METKTNNEKIEELHKNLGEPLESVRLVVMGSLHGLKKINSNYRLRRRIIKKIDNLKALLDDEFFKIDNYQKESPYYRLKNRKETFELLNVGKELNQK